MRWQEYQVASSLAEATAALAAGPDQARVVAGGTDLMVQIERGRLVAPPPLLVDITRLEELRGIFAEGGRLSIGAATTMTELIESPLVRQHAPALAEGAAAAASWQIRDVATVGGNLVNASPAADTAAPLVALDAAVEIVGPGGFREIPVSLLALSPGRTCLEPGEVVTRILVPLLGEGEGQAFVKLGRRQALSISVVNAAACVRVEGNSIRDARLALGAVGPTVALSRAASGLLGGRAPDAETWSALEAALSSEVEPISDIRAGADYRRSMAGVYGRRALETAYQRALASDGPKGGL
jgi:CO/xanthine dehydrogenase FAD-binding subunit